MKLLKILFIYLFVFICLFTGLMAQTISLDSFNSDYNELFWHSQISAQQPDVEFQNSSFQVFIDGSLAQYQFVASGQTINLGQAFVISEYNPDDESVAISHGDLYLTVSAEQFFIEALEQYEDNEQNNFQTIVQYASDILSNSFEFHYDDNSITSANILDNTIGSLDIADGTIENIDLAVNSITSANIATDAVGTDEIINGSIQSEDIAADAITGSHISDNAVRSEHIFDGTIQNRHLAVNSITSANIATDAVGTDEIINESIQSEDITDGTIVAADLATGSVGTDEIINESIQSEDIADGTIVAADLATGSVGTDEIINESIKSEDIAEDAITGSHISDSAIRSEHILDGSIGSVDIADSSIEINHLGQTVMQEFTDLKFGLAMQAAMTRSSQGLDGKRFTFNIGFGNFESYTAYAVGFNYVISKHISLSFSAASPLQGASAHLRSSSGGLSIGF